MTRLLPFLILLLYPALLQAQEHIPGALYHGSPDRVNDLVHTRLAVSFDFPKARMSGDVQLTLKPHGYATDSLRLDAKGMAIESVEILEGAARRPLSFTYDSMNLCIRLPRSYRAGEAYTVRVRYEARPDEYAARSYGLMSGEKGLYFINPRGNNKDKPTQLWTQGETEANSYWVPTIDKPNQKTTSEIAMTVPVNYVTLSNGLLAATTVNGNGTRTDTWKMTQPHAPYLMFMGAGEYAVVKDQYKGKEVSYYVEKEYAPVARRIFGNTPEMIGLFSRLTGVDFPWAKYAQITGRDYIFGAMENTTATLHAESAQQDMRELSDENSWELIIAHELFHQWFGDYVTTESWSNTTLNESFADYSETLWNEYKYGKEAGEQQIYQDRLSYLANSSLRDKKLVSFNYGNAFEMFDQVSYQKGGTILHMLRNYVGDSAFFRSIRLYLDTYKYGSAEAQQLRLAFEDVTGKDLNWFWNQWYYGSGHPKLDISYRHDAAGKVLVRLAQTQDGAPFRIPLAIDVYTGGSGKPARYPVWLQNRVDSFSLPAPTRPDLVNVDADKVLLAEKKEAKNASEYLFQYHHGNYIDRHESIRFFLDARRESGRTAFLSEALKDRNKDLRRFVLQQLNIRNDTLQRALAVQLEGIARHDPQRLVRADAIETLGFYSGKKYKPLFEEALSDSSYTVAGKALQALSGIDSIAALQQARRLMTHPARKTLHTVMADLLSRGGTAAELDYVYTSFARASPNGHFDLLQSMANALARDTDAARVRRQVNAIVRFRDELPEFVRVLTEGMINQTLLLTADARKGDPGLESFIRSKVPLSK